MNDPVIVRVVLDHMKQTVHHALMDHTGEIGRIAKAAVDQAFSEVNISAEIHRLAREEVGRLFRETVTREALGRVYDTLRDKKLQGTIRREVLKALVVESER